MDEFSVVSQTTSPNTRLSLGGEFRRLGLGPGMAVIVHSSLSAIGWVSGGPVTVVQALMDALTLESTLVMPTHSGDYSDPAKWENPPVPQSWWEEIRHSMPAYDARYTPSRGMGAIPEVFRNFPDVLRSDHPALSFAAWGKDARRITQGHTLDNCLGETSPLARLYDLDGWVLLLGVGYGNNTSFHLAEYRIHNPVQAFEGAPMIEGGQRVWKVYRDVNLDSDCFETLGADFEKQGEVKIGKVGNAVVRLFRQCPAVDFAVEWLNKAKI
ncbi:MAG: AAC(3) family N-acetyltransferase [Chloroflexi bacterium]|nr:AAC(3) family N-acetyltransferase [Chloroflexota bacterium]